MEHNMKGRVRSRPLRIAFLMAESEHAQLILDGIFADCYSRWGGRFSLIILCDGDRIPESYWPWLEAFDPDIVYSYVPLSRNAILEVHERLCPSEFKLHWIDEGNPRLDVFGCCRVDDWRSPVDFAGIDRRIYRTNL